MSGGLARPEVVVVPFVPERYVTRAQLAEMMGVHVK
jgi:hypothetical protein